MEFWASRCYSAFISVHTSASNSESHVSVDIVDEGDEGIRGSFQCPFCYVDIEVPLLCSHLQDEHCFDVNHSVCPLCAASPGKDLIGHLAVQHSQLLKVAYSYLGPNVHESCMREDLMFYMMFDEFQKRRSRKSVSNNNTAMLGKDFQELSSFLGIYPTNDGGDAQASSPESQLSPFLSIPIYPNPEANEQLDIIVDENAISSLRKSKRKGYNSVEQQHTDEEKIQRVECIQQLVLSTIF